MKKTTRVSGEKNCEYSGSGKASCPFWDDEAGEGCPFNWCILFKAKIMTRSLTGLIGRCVECKKEFPNGIVITLADAGEKK